MRVLGIETSCDETAAAVVQDGKKLLSNVVVSQIDIHKEFGGVVPEVAARSHIEAILPTINKALCDAFTEDDRQTTKKESDELIKHTSRASEQNLEKGAAHSIFQAPDSDLWSQIDAIAVTHGPGLQGSLLIGTLTARALALAKEKPLYPINHVEAHTYANFVTEVSSNSKLEIENSDVPQKAPKFPLLSLTVSGGHTQLVLFHDHGEYELLGRTRDDAVGEAFDKVSMMLGLGYPGGPAIARAAEVGNSRAFSFPKGKISKSRDFSFSGLKTAVLRHIQELIEVDYSFPSFEIAQYLTQEQINDVAASFQHIAVQTLVDRTLEAYHMHKPVTVVIAGGVAANQELRRQLDKQLPVSIEYAPIELCTDNAAMVAARGYFAKQLGETADPLSLETAPSLSM